jgi:CRISPR-associated endoribonuclease Cas6
VGGRVVLEVRLLEDGLAVRLAAHAVPAVPVRLGRHWLAVAGVPVLDIACSWSEFVGERGRRAWEVGYRSPTTFRRGTRTSPWPAPESVLTSLAARWRALRPQTAPELSRDLARSVWVSDVEGRSECLRLRGTVVSGFVGRIRYVCDGPDEAAATVGALFAFAQFAGIGSHTAFGLGTIDLSPTWQPSHAASDGRAE